VTPDRYPVAVGGELQDGLSRWLWLVKWLLVLPHLICLAVLWIAFALLTVGGVRRPSVHRPLPALHLRLRRRRAHPAEHRRGLALIGWWLIGIPQCAIAGALAGGIGTQPPVGGVIGVVTIVAGLVLLIGRPYPRELFDFVLGLDRWVLRVLAYAAFLTPVYPPFRFDGGGREEGGS
jgi:hypothetical protein